MKSFVRFSIARLILVIFVLPLSALGKEPILAPQEIYQQVAGSVALIRDLESHGSGVVLSRDGLILTNFHVVASGLPISVTVKVKEGDKLVDRTFDDIIVSKVHPEYDLALLKIDLPAGKLLLPAKLMGPNDRLATGSACYAIGNPGGLDGAALEHSITEGLVSAASRVIDGEEYIQTSAALNPGNSGGAVTDGQGRVIGIATWKLEQADNIGFAIPLQKLKLAQFIPLAQRKDDFELATKYDKKAEGILAYSQNVDGDEQIRAIQAAEFFYRKSLEAAPNDAAPYSNLGMLYFRLKQDDIARRYLEKALQLNPDNAPALDMLGIIIMRGDGNLNLAKNLWFRGSTDNDHLRAASECVENLAIMYSNAKEFASAAYCITWANAVQTVEGQRNTVREAIWGKAVEILSDSQFATLKAKKTGFSKADMEAFAKSDATLPNPKNPIVSTAQIPKASVVDSKIYMELAAKMVAAGVTIPPEGLVKPLPASPRNVSMGYAGTCLLMKFPELKRLGVFDLCQAKIVKYIDLAEDDVLFTAGGQVLLIYYPGPNRFEVWDMASWTKEKDIALRSDRKIVVLSMGLLNPYFAIAVRDDTRSGSEDKLAIVSLPDCKVFVPNLQQASQSMDLLHFTSRLGKNTQIAVEESGGLALVCGAGRAWLNLNDLNNIEAYYQFSNGGHNGGIVFGGSAIVLTTAVYLPKEEEELLSKMDKKLNVSEDREVVTSVFGYRGIAEIVSRRKENSLLKVRALPDLNEVASFPANSSYGHVFESGDTSLRFFASAYVRRFAVVDPVKNTVTIYPMPKEAVGISSEFISANLFKRTLSFPEGTTVTVDSAPKGVVFDRKTGQIRWEIPSEQMRGVEVSVVLLLTDSAGKESYQIEKIAVP